MHRGAHLVLMSCACTAALLALHGNASATTFVMMSDEDLVRSSAVVAVGTVEELQRKTSQKDLESIFVQLVSD